jgi:peptidyl-prolyl cis-trans isomerase SurA
MLGSGEVDKYVRANAAARWKSIASGSKINEEFQAELRRRGVQTREQAQNVQKEFVQAKQRAMIEQLRAEARSRVKGGSVKQAREEIIEERLKLQAAKKLGIAVSESEVDSAIGEMAKRNNKTDKEFASMLAGVGVDIKTMRQRIRAGMVWRDVIRRKFGHQISVGMQDIERALSTQGDAGQAASAVDLKLQRITLPIAPGSDEKTKAQRLAEAEKLRKSFTSCKQGKSLAQRVQGANFEDLGTKPASSISEPTRSILISAKIGEMAPPSYTSSGIELYAVCGRSAQKMAAAKREEVTRELQNQEFELLARRYLKDLRQDAVIEYR